MKLCCCRRIAARKDSCSLVAVSLNMQEKVHPTIWSMNGLPFDCFAAHPVPKPIGTCNSCATEGCYTVEIHLCVLLTSSADYSVLLLVCVNVCMVGARAYTCITSICRWCSCVCCQFTSVSESKLSTVWSLTQQLHRLFH